MESELEVKHENQDKYECECGKVVLKRNMSKHLKSIKHDYRRLKKDAFDRLGDWTLEKFEVINPINEIEK